MSGYAQHPPTIAPWLDPGPVHPPGFDPRLIGPPAHVKPGLFGIPGGSPGPDHPPHPHHALLHALAMALLAPQA